MNKQKKLMILGGTRYMLPIIKTAHDYGVHVITCDYLPDNIAHKYSDEYCNVNIVDKDAVLSKAIDLKIDAITSFACDPGVVTAAYVAEKLGLPSCGPYDSVCILQNKRRFREFLSNHGFNVPKAKAYTQINNALSDISHYNWPVIVKPTDAAGSKGVTRVDEPERLKNAIEYALSFSMCKEFIIEDFIAQKGFSSDTDSFSVDGKFKFISFNSQRFDAKAGNPYTPSAYSWPSSMTQEHQNELASELQRLITLLNMGTSIYNIETREGVDGKAYIMECAPRGGGNRLAECLEYATGVKLVDNVVRAALGMPVSGIEQRPYDGCWAEVVLHSSADGIFDRVWISKDIRESVIEEDLWVRTGDEVEDFTASNCAIGTIVLKFENEDKLQKVMNNVEEYVKVLLR